MISATHIVAGYVMGKILEAQPEETLLASVLPDIDILMDFIYPFTHRGLLHTPFFGFIAALTYSWLSDDRQKFFPVFSGWMTHLGLDSLTSSGVPLFFPFPGTFSLSLTYASDPYWNLTIISICTGILVAKTHSEVFRPFLKTS